MRNIKCLDSLHSVIHGCMHYGLRECLVQWSTISHGNHREFIKIPGPRPHTEWETLGLSRLIFPR